MVAPEPQKAPRVAEGVLAVDKPAGPTSHDLVEVARRALGRARVGHAGTLDPFATGLLLLLVGRATRLAEYASALEKTYLATVRLGASSTTGDPQGEIDVLEPAPSPPSEAELRKTLARFVGESDQVPPSFSARWVGGERAHRLARRGAVVVLEARRVRIGRIDLLGYAYPEARLRVSAGPGTYIRSLARDLGHALRSAAYLTELRRESVGPFVADGAPDPRVTAAAGLLRRLLPPEAAVAHLPALTLDGSQALALTRGQRLPASAFADPPTGTLALFGPGGFLGVGELDPATLRGVKILYPARAAT